MASTQTTPCRFSMEDWRTIPSLPEYEASSFGWVRRKKTNGKMPRGGTRTYGGEARPGTWNKQDRRYILVYRGITHKVARLVCEAFHGPPPTDDAVCMHLNELSFDNRPKNLKWGTQKENLNAPGFIEYCKSRTGENSPTAKHRRRTAGEK